MRLGAKPKCRRASSAGNIFIVLACRRLIINIFPSAARTGTRTKRTICKKLGGIGIPYFDRSVIRCPIVGNDLVCCGLLIRDQDNSGLRWLCDSKGVNAEGKRIFIVVAEQNIRQAGAICEVIRSNERCRIRDFCTRQRSTALKPVRKIIYLEVTHIIEPDFGNLRSQMRPGLIVRAAESLTAAAARNHQHTGGRIKSPLHGTVPDCTGIEILFF